MIPIGFERCIKCNSILFNRHDMARCYGCHKIMCVRCFCNSTVDIPLRNRNGIIIKEFTTTKILCVPCEILEKIMP